MVTNNYVDSFHVFKITYHKYTQALIVSVHAVADPGGFIGFHGNPLSKVKIILMPIFMQQLKTYLKTYFVLLHSHS